MDGRPCDGGARGAGPPLPPHPGGQRRQRPGTARGAAGSAPAPALLRLLDLVGPAPLVALARPVVDLAVAIPGLRRALRHLGPGDLAGLDADPRPAASARGDRSRGAGPRAGPRPAGG